MSAPRFSLRMLLVATAYIAVVLVAFLSGSAQWSDAVYTISIGIILVATLAAIFLNGSKRVFFSGFSVCGWLYLVVAFAPFTQKIVRDHLLTDQLLKSCQRKLGPKFAARAVQPGFQLEKATGDVEAYRINATAYYEVFQGPEWYANQRTGHSAWAGLLGLVGGYLAANFKKRNTARPRP